MSRASGARPVGSRELPARASLESLRNQAKTLLKQHREGQPEALRRVAEVLGGAQLPLNYTTLSSCWRESMALPAGPG